MTDKEDRPQLSVVPTARASGPHPATGEFVQEFVLPGGWMAAVYLGEQAGRSVVTELRVFPAVELGNAGEWSHSREAQEGAPAGGLTTQVLRSIPVAQFAEDARRERGFYAEVLAELDERNRVVSARRPGPRGRPDGFYAELAERYVRLVAAGHRAPIQQLADEYGLSARTMESRLGEARKRGLLSRPRSGVPGGELTEKGRAALQEQK